MPKKPTLEQRVLAIEKELAALKRRLRRQDRNWLDEVSGSMKRFPEFEEVVRFGKEFRAQQNGGRR
jgi:hypothetical protein